jgi:ribosomal protein S18 acetylase RimI-like enzyme
VQHPLFRYINRFAALLKDSWRESRGKSDWRRIKQLAAVLIYPFYRRGVYVIMTRSLAELTIPTPSSAGIVVRAIQEADIPSMQAVSSASDGERFTRLLAQGSMGFVAESDGQVAGYCWASPYLIRSLHRVDIPLQPGDVLVHDILTVPKFRRRGVARAMVTRLFVSLREQGYHRAVNHVRADNQAALATHKSLGYLEEYCLIHRRFLWVDHFRCVPLAGSRR